MGAAANNTNQHDNSSAVVNPSMSPSSPRDSGDSYGGTHSRRARSIRVGESEVPVAVDPSLPPPPATGTPNPVTAECSGCGIGSGSGADVASLSPSEGVWMEGQDGDSAGIGNGNGGKKPAWNKPSTGGNFESGPVMSGEFWPPLSESTKASPKSSPPDPSRISPVDLQESFNLVPGNPSLASASACPSSPSQKHVTGNANPNATQNHGRPARQKSMKRESGCNLSSLPGSVGEGFHNDSSVKAVSGGSVEGAATDRGLAQNNANKESGQRNSGDLPQQQQQQRSSYRRGNGGLHSRGDSSHRNHGDRRDSDRGNPDWNHQRNFSSRDPYMQTPRPFLRGPMRPPPPVHAPVMPASSFHRTFVGPHISLDYQPVMYYGPPVMNTFLPQMRPMYIPSQDAFPPQDSLLSEKIVKQIEYYFSNENLVRDTYLRKQMGDQGWVPISLIAEFKKMKQLTSNIQLILDSVMGSSVVEVQGDRIRRREDWNKWIMPSHVPGPEPPRFPGKTMLVEGLQNIGLQ